MRLSAEESPSSVAELYVVMAASASGTVGIAIEVTFAGALDVDWDEEGFPFVLDVGAVRLAEPKPHDLAFPPHAEQFRRYDPRNFLTNRCLATFQLHHDNVAMVETT